MHYSQNGRRNTTFYDRNARFLQTVKQCRAKVEAGENRRVPRAACRPCLARAIGTGRQAARGTRRTPRKKLKRRNLLLQKGLR